MGRTISCIKPSYIAGTSLIFISSVLHLSYIFPFSTPQLEDRLAETGDSRDALSAQCEQTLDRLRAVEGDNAVLTAKISAVSASLTGGM